MSSITITLPVTRQIVQRSTMTTGSLVMSGTSVGIADGQHVQGQFNGGAITRVATVTANAWSGTLSAQTAGQGTLNAFWEESPATTTSVAIVGIGDLFPCGGQSNMVGMGDNAQTYSNAHGLKASFSPLNGASWGDLTESPGGGSFRPPLATLIMARTGVPVGFIMCAASGTSISSWLPSDVSGNYTAYIKNGTLLAAPQGTRAFLFWEGESDAIAGTAQATYKADLDIITAAVFSDLGVKTASCQLQTFSAATAPNQLLIRNAIGQVWAGGAPALTGPDLSSISVGLHVTSDADLASAATLWFNALVAAGQLPTQARGHFGSLTAGITRGPRR